MNAATAGYSTRRQIFITEEDYDKLIKINIKATFYFIKETLHLLKKGTDANILINSSMVGLHTDRFSGAYAMTKAALINLAKWMYMELVDDNIRVNVIAPGMVHTQMT